MRTWNFPIRFHQVLSSYDYFTIFFFHFISFGRSYTCAMLLYETLKSLMRFFFCMSVLFFPVKSKFVQLTIKLFFALAVFCSIRAGNRLRYHRIAMQIRVRAAQFYSSVFFCTAQFNWEYVIQKLVQLHLLSFRALFYNTHNSVVSKWAFIIFRKRNEFWIKFALSRSFSQI